MSTFLSRSGASPDGGSGEVGGGLRLRVECLVDDAVYGLGPGFLEKAPRLVRLPRVGRRVFDQAAGDLPICAGVVSWSHETALCEKNHFLDANGDSLGDLSLIFGRERERETSQDDDDEYEYEYEYDEA